MRIRISLPLALAYGLFTHAALAADAPPEHKGFQLAVRTGVQVPLGNVERPSATVLNTTFVANQTTAMSDALGPQIPIHVEIGGKPIPELFIGGYAGAAFGGAAGRLSDACDQTNLSCSALDLRVGFELQYHILPGERINPWIGYGIGWEVTGVSGKDGDRKLSYTYSGPEYAHLMGGFDVRISRVIGIGPVVDFAIGSYTSRTVESSAGNGTTNKNESDIPSGARETHFWLFIGPRIVFFP